MSLLKPLFIFVHLQKTAGSSLAKHIEHNFTKEQQLLIEPRMLGLDNLMPRGIPKALEKHFKQQKNLDGLQILYGHILTSNTKKIAERITKGQRPFYFFTILREPAKRVVSLYNYYSKWYWFEHKDQRSQEIFHRNLLVNGKYPSFLQWYEHKFKQTAQYFSMRDSAEYFQELGYLEKGRVTKKKIRKCFEQFYFVGTTETFTADSAYLYYLWGFDKFFVNQNISPKYFRLKEHPKIYTRMKKDLKNAYLLYDLGKEHRKKFIQNHPEYVTAQETIGKKRKMTSVHQLLYDWPNNAHVLSAYLRETIPGYGWLKDNLPTHH